MTTLSRNELTVDSQLAEFIEQQLLPGTGITNQHFWQGFSQIIRDLTPINIDLLKKRTSLQAKIDTYHQQHSQWDDAHYRAFLYDIGYLVAEPHDFEIETQNVEPEIANTAGPQLVVPVSNARFALNAANARWGSLYDALYGTDVLSEEIYTFLKQADARELDHLYKDLDAAKASGGNVQAIVDKIDNFESHVVPIIADIDAGFGNEEATYLLAKKMIEAGACAIQIENQVSDAKQCGHQAGKVTVPHEDFLAKINAVRYAFLELGIDNGVIVARTDSLGASLTQKVPVSKEPGDLASQYNAFLETTPINGVEDLNEGETAMKLNGQLCKPTRLDNGLFQFREGTEKDRVVLDCVTSLQSGADLLWIETEKPHVKQIAELVNRVKEQVPNAKLVYNNSPSFNWTLKFREQVYQQWSDEGKDLSAYPSIDDNKALMAPEMDNTELAQAADVLVQNFQRDGAREAGIFHHLITLPTYHTAALSTDILSEGYFGDLGMLAYVRDVQRQEIRREQASVKHQDLAGSNMGDTHKEYFSGENALKAGGEANTMNQF